MRQRVRAGPAPGKIIGKWVGHELEALGLKPSTSRDVPVPVGGKGCAENREVKGEVQAWWKEYGGKQDMLFFQSLITVYFHGATRVSPQICNSSCSSQIFGKDLILSIKLYLNIL